MDWRDGAQRAKPDDRRTLANSALFRTAIPSDSAASPSNTDNMRKPSSILQLTPADELAALTAFMAALPWNALPSHINPNVPLDPNIILDFDPSHPRARSEMDALRRETWQLNPVVLFGKSRNAPTREIRSALENIGVDTNAVMQFDMADRVDSDLVMNVLRRLVSTVDPDRKSTRLNSSHSGESRMPSSA